MKNIFTMTPKRLISAVVILLVFAGIVSSVMAAFGPNRPTKAWSPNVDGFDHVTFNSFTGVPNGIGDERDFVRGVQVGRDSTWSDPVQGVQQDAEVEVKIYIHNGADARLNSTAGQPGIARNVQVRAALPTDIKQVQEAKAFISADNAQPKEVFDTVTMTGANEGFFALEYVPGSAKLHKNGTSTTLSDNLVTTGVNIGNINGCFEFVQEVTFRVKVKMPHYTVQKKVRFEGQTKNDWKESIDIKDGDTAEWKIEFDNIGRTQLQDVVILDELPEHLSVVPGSVKRIDGNYPSGIAYKDADAIQNNGRHVNVSIGNVNAGINSIVTFKTTVKPNGGDDRCSTQELINKAYATPKQFHTISDTAKVVLEGVECEQPEEPIYFCNVLETKKLGVRKFQFTVKATAKNGATIKQYRFDFGDGSEELVTDQATREYTYAKSGTYAVRTKVDFMVDGQLVTQTSQACETVINTDKEIENCPIVGKEHLPKNSPDCVTVPTELPSTGPADMIGLFAAVTVAASLAHKFVYSRRFI